MKSKSRKLGLLVTVLIFTLTAGHAQQTAGGDTERDNGIRLYKQGNFRDAANELRIAVNKNKNDAQAWFYLGLSLTRTGDAKEASKAYENALALQPNSANARAGLATTLLLRNKLNDALREAERTLEFDNGSADAHYIIGVVRLRTGNNEKALDEANTAIRLNPNVAQYYLLKSQALLTFVEESDIGDVNEKHATRLARNKEVVANIKEYLSRSPDKSQQAKWTDQLEALQFSIDTLEGKTDVLGASQVTTLPRVLSKPEPSYTQVARINGVTGTVVLRAVFAADGLVRYIVPIHSLPDGLTEEAIAAARKIKFVPATKDGKPISMWMQLEYNFHLF